MIGRQAYQQPYFLTELETLLSKDYQAPSRLEIIAAYIPYIHQQLRNGARLHDMTRHLLGLFNGQPGARSWRRYLSTTVHQVADPFVFTKSLSAFEGV